MSQFPRPMTWADAEVRGRGPVGGGQVARPWAHLPVLQKLRAGGSWLAGNHLQIMAHAQANAHESHVNHCIQDTVRTST